MLRSALIGVDPGLTGAMAIHYQDLDVVKVFDYNNPACLLALRDLQGMYVCFAALELVNPMPKQGISTTSKFMRNAGIWEGRFMGLGIPYKLVLPRVWQKTVLFDVGRPDSDTKERSLLKARADYPQLEKYLKRKKDHNRADALNILTWLRERNIYE